MIDPSLVAFDFDSVIADTMTLFLDIARTEYCIQDLRYDDITSYFLETCLNISPEILREIGGKIIDGDYSHPLRSMAGASEVLGKVAKHHAPVLLVTARPYLGPVGEWLKTNTTLSPDQVEVVTTGSHEDKAQVLVSRGVTHFVEDRLETCHILQEAGITPILYRQPWNRQPHPFLEVGTWEELAGLIDFAE